MPVNKLGGPLEPVIPCSCVLTRNFNKFLQLTLISQNLYLNYYSYLWYNYCSKFIMTEVDFWFEEKIFAHEDCFS